ncbi:MAG: M6 family metalloprotease domain-containing protein [Longimicrobiales bacterium]|nr:M6 family metalloprotease domain-containing protein [Longimicrobiales bacterium]
MRRPWGPGGARRVGWAVALAVVFASGLPVRARAQHVAAPVPASGAVLPAAYFERLAADPTAFTLPNGLFRVGPDGQPMMASATGTKAMLVLPALFADSPEPQVAPADIQRLLFDGPAPRGTLTESYLEMSRGKLRVAGRVLPWVRTSLTRAVVVGANAGLGNDAKVGPYLLEALVSVDALVDFGAYDNDGLDGVANSGDDDGFVDAMAFEFIEVAGSCGGPGIWPHLWGITPQNNGQPFFSADVGPTGVPIRVDAYIVQSAVDCGGVNPQDAATIAHEFGHVLGLPDYYHPTTSGGAEVRRWVLGCWELMAAGSWGCGPHAPAGEPFGPTHMSARSKNYLGWLDYVTVGQVWDQEIVLEPVQKSGQALRIPLDTIGREHLLVEYRTRTGFDAQIPAEGLLVYHEDVQGAFRPNPATTTPYYLSLVEQDDNRGLVRNTLEGGNRGEAGDAWGVGGAVQELHLGTSPSLRLHAGGGATTVTFHEMVVKDGNARVRLSTGATPRVVAPTQALTVTQVTPFERRLRIAGGAMPYVASGSVPVGVTLVAEGDDLVLRGAVTSAGPFQLALRVTDAEGTSSTPLLVPLTAGQWVVGDDRLLQAFLRSGAAPLTAGELTYLDFGGNGNGRYDVGDLRAQLRRKAAAGG